MKKLLFLLILILIVVAIYKNKKEKVDVQSQINAIEKKYSYAAIPARDPKRSSGINSADKRSVDMIAGLRTSLYENTKVSALDLIFSNSLEKYQEYMKKFFTSEFDEKIRRSVLENMTKYQDKDVLDLLALVVQKDGSQSNRLFALDKMVKFKHPDLLPLLVEAKERNSNKDVRVEAAKAYETLNYEIEERRAQKEQEIQLLINNK